MKIVLNILLCFGNGLVLSQTPLSDFTQSILSKSMTQKRIRPLLDKEIPVDVYVSISIYDIISIKDLAEEYSIICTIRQSWKDDRLAFSGYNGSIILNPNQVDRIWTPDLSVKNLKSGSVHPITAPNRQLLISPDGTVSYSQRLSLTLTCKMMLFMFPMDNQTCYIEFESYGYPTEHINLHWDEKLNPIVLDEQITLTEYDITSVTHSVCFLKFEQTGEYSCLRAYIKLKRRMDLYLKGIYLPSIMIVVLSWVTFWIDPSAISARTSLSVLTVMTIIAQSASVAKSFGPYTNAIDYWMASCVVFVFAAFVKVLVVHNLANHAKKAKTPITIEEGERPPESEKILPKIDYLKLKKVSKVMFPLSFIVFNVGYWTCYLWWGRLV